MKTKYIEGMSAFEVCQLIDEHPNAKIIDITAVGSSPRPYTIFYQEI